MATSTDKPNVLICGGLNTYARTLVAYLVPLNGDPLVSHVRIVDKYSVMPPTTYLGAEFPKILSSPIVEYKQANLTVPATIPTIFEPTAGKSAFDYVFDLTGEVRPDRPEMVQIKTTCHVSRMIALEAAKRKVKAFVRLQLPFYETPAKGDHTEKEEAKPSDVIGTWWHETLRMLADIDDLNLVIVRIGLGYGPYIDYGDITAAMAVASVYGYMKKPMKSLWSPGKHPMNTVHAVDIAGGLWASAGWVAGIGRKEANTVAGEDILFYNSKNKVKEVEGMPAHDKKLVAPLFNLVDDTNSTLASNSENLTSFFGTTHEFFNFIENKFLQLKEDSIEDINEHHVGGWTEMLVKSNPPIPDTPLSAYLDKYSLAKHVIGFNNTKIKEVVGYKLQYPKFNHDAVKEVVDKWKEEGSWPILDDK